MVSAFFTFSYCSLVFIMCYNCLSHQSLDNIENFWYPETYRVEPNTPFILVGNKLDLAQSNPKEYVNFEDAKELAARLGSQAMECSAKWQIDGKDGHVEQVIKAALLVGIQARVKSKARTENGGCAQCCCMF